MHPYGLSVSDSSEHGDPPHSDNVEIIERLDFPLSNPIESNERLGVSDLNAMENNEHLGLPSSEEPSRIHDLGGTLDRPPSEESRRPTEADKLWDNLKAETGYSSYADYLRAYNEKHPYLERVLHPLTQLAATKRHADRASRFTILDLSNDEDSRPRVVPRCDSISVTSIVTTLRQPPANVAVQIVLWNTTGYLNENVVNALGLGLEINPRFLELFVVRVSDIWVPSTSKLVGLSLLYCGIISLTN